MRYKVEGKLHLWGWMDFKSSINAQVIDYKTEGNYIHWIEFETDIDADALSKTLDKYSLKIVNEDKVSESPKIDTENEPMMFYKIDKSKQDALIRWINTNFVKIKTINEDRTSFELKDLFKEFPITNGEFKGAMVEKCKFQYDPNDGVNWYFNLSKKSPVFLSEQLHERGTNHMEGKRPVYEGYAEHYMNGMDIKNYFKNCYLCFGKHHSQVSSYAIDFGKYYTKIKDDVTYRLFINNDFCSIFDNITDKKLYYFGYIKEKPQWAKD